MEGVPKTAVLVLVFLCGVCSIIHSEAYAGGSYELYKTLFENYTSILRPVKDENDTLRIKVKFLLRGISEFDEVAGQLSLATAVDLRWRDPILQWNMSRYKVKALVLPETDVWTPRLALSNPTDRILLFSEDTFPIRMYADGSIIWLQGGTITSTCVPNVEKFPFDIHKCQLVIMALPYTRPEVQLYPSIDINNFERFGEWELGNHRVSEELFGGFFSSIIITLDIKRRPEFSLLSTIIPILFLGVLNSCVFVLPPEQGERVSYSITVLLSFAVFLSIVSSVMPKNSEPVPILCYVVTAMMAMSGSITICTIITLRLFYTDESKQVPHLFQILCRKSKHGGVPADNNFRNTCLSDLDNGLSGNRVMLDKNCGVSWKDVCATLDMIFFWMFLILFFVLVIVYLILVHP